MARVQCRMWLPPLWSLFSLLAVPSAVAQAAPAAAQAAPVASKKAPAAMKAPAAPTAAPVAPPAAPASGAAAGAAGSAPVQPAAPVQPKAAAGAPSPTIIGTPAQASQLVDRIQRFYDQTRDLHAHFEQTLELGLGGRPKRASGDVYLKKPGRMRWDYEKPEKKLMVADGTTLWVYEEEDAQVWKQPLGSSSLPAQVSFLVGQGRLADEFEAALVTLPGVGAADDQVLRLVPKSATGSYRLLLFVVDGKSGQVKETIIYDQQGGTNRLRFSGVEINPGVDDGKFKFSPPAGVKVLSPPRGG